MVTRSEPQTLRDAHAVVADLRPAPDAQLSVWLKFHQGNARMYKAVSDVDRGHHHEAVYWANYEERKASDISAGFRTKDATTD